MSVKKQRTAGAKGRVRGGRRHARSFRTGLAFLAAGLLLFSSGCGASKEAEPEALEPEHIVSVTVVNASDDAVTAILIDWSDTLGAEAVRCSGNCRDRRTETGRCDYGGGAGAG